MSIKQKLSRYLGGLWEYRNGPDGGEWREFVNGVPVTIIHGWRIEGHWHARTHGKVWIGETLDEAIEMVTSWLVAS